MENAWLIVGLGNPGRQYARTRHNAGFMVLDLLGRRWNAEWVADRKFNARVARTNRNRQNVFLFQPQTFMNASGEAVGSMAAYYQVPLPRVLVAVDDADLPLGQIRLRPRGRSGGHHGLESLERHLGGRDFPRLRLGIGRRENQGREITGHVLAPFEVREREVLDRMLARSCDQIECWMEQGIEKAMSGFNGLVTI
jgi:peptidyl-tRNA hydrolase, PTH1 family